jgi:alpha-1,2-mannosyltransferase
MQSGQTQDSSSSAIGGWARFRDSPLRRCAELGADRRVRRALQVIALAAIAIHVTVILLHRATNRGDFDISREFGRRFITGEYLYTGGLHFPYLPAAAMSFAPLAMVNPHAGILIRYAVALACLWTTFRMMFAMIRARAPALEAHRLAIGALTIVLGSHYLIRDLDDGGPHLILMAIAVGGIYCFWRGRGALGAVWLGLATALKVTPGLFVPYLLWKREWRLAALTGLAAALWIALPVVRMGPEDWWRHQRDWMGAAAGFAIERNPQAAAYYGDRSIQNQSLKAAVVSLIEGVEPRDVPAAPLSPARARTASVASLAAIIALLAVFGWLTRSRFTSREDPAWPVEASAVLVLIPLLSPITWTQHLVLIIPALYLIIAEDVGVGELGALAASAMWLYFGLAVVLNRELLGKPIYSWLLCFHIHTIAMLLVLGVLMSRRPAASLARA